MTNSYHSVTPCVQVYLMPSRGLLMMIMDPSYKISKKKIRKIRICLF